MSSNGERKRILVVDDESHVVIYLETLLQDNGYETVSAANGIEGMKQVKNEKPDLICLDITMPEQSGIRFYRDLKEDPDFRSIPIVIVTAVTGAGSEPEPLKKFVEDYKEIPFPEALFSKPIKQQKFLDRIAELLQ